MVELGEAAKMLKIDPMILFKMVSRGDVPGAVKDGYSWRVDLAELKLLIETKPRPRRRN